MVELSASTLTKSFCQKTYGKSFSPVRRVIPRDIVGGHVIKLRRMDAVVHILYEVSGTAGALLSSVLIRQLGMYLIINPSYIF